MGRKPKYATVKNYRPYIEVIQRDLQLPDSLYINLYFGLFSSKGGDARYVNERYANIRITKDQGHEWTIQALLHEIKHIEQFHTKRLEHHCIKKRNGKCSWHYKWKGEVHLQYNKYVHSDNPTLFKLYEQSPWEIEAVDYEKSLLWLFPNLELPARRIYIGQTTKGTKFYKVKQ